jgi:GTP-binding protein
LMRDYLRGRSALMRAFVLADGRHGLKDSDIETMKLLDASAVSYAIVLTKRDEVKLADQQTRVDATLEALRTHPAAYPGTFFTSSRTGEGIPELRGHIMQLMRERGL